MNNQNQQELIDELALQYPISSTFVHKQNQVKQVESHNHDPLRPNGNKSHHTLSPSFSIPVQLEKGVSMNLLYRCFEPLLKLKQCQILASAINEDLMIKIKQSLAALKSLYSPANKKGKKAMTKDNTQAIKTGALEEISKLTEYFQNIQVMQKETARLQESLTTETDQLNKEIQAEFDRFRKKPTKIKKFE